MRTSMVDRPVVRIIRMRKVPFIDSTGIHNLEILIHSAHKEGIHIVLSGVNPGVRHDLDAAGIDKIMVGDHICDHITKAVEVANKIAENEQKWTPNVKK